jgi:O-antigen/teichoic acid export membrane protein
MFIGSIVGPTGVLLKSTDNQKYSMYNSVFSTFTNVIINLFLIPMLGIIGAAYASIASSLIGNFAGAVENYYEEGIHAFHRGIIPIFIASTISLITTYLMINAVKPVTPIWALIPGLIVYCSIYGILLIALGGLKEEDREIIEKIFKKIGHKDVGEKVAEIVIR